MGACCNGVLVTMAGDNPTLISTRSLTGFWQHDDLDGDDDEFYPGSYKHILLDISNIRKK